MGASVSLRLSSSTQNGIEPQSGAIGSHQSCLCAHRPKAFVAYAAAGKESRQDVAHGVAPGGHAHLCSSREAVQTPQIGAQAAQIHDSEALLITLVLA